MAWEVKKLGDVLKLEYGKPLPADKRKQNGKYPVYGANGEKNRSDEYYYDKLSIIVGRKGSAGEINFTEEKFWPLDVTYFVTFDNKKYDLNFIYYLLSNLELPSLAKGVKPGINRNEVYSINAPIPPLPVQKRIVAILDEAFESIAKAKENAEKNLKNATEIFESYLQSVFENKGEGWEEIKLQDLSNNYKKDIVDGPFGSDLKRSHYLTFGVPVLKLQNVKQGRFELKNLDYVSPEKALSLKRHAFQSGDIVMTKLGAPLGVSAIVQNMVDGIIVADLVRIRAQKINTDYLCYFLNSPKIRKFINSKQKGTTRPRIRLSVVRELPILFPKNEKDQQSIVAKLNTLSAETKKLEAIYTQKLADLEELKKSILAKAFKGELTEVSI